MAGAARRKAQKAGDPSPRGDRGAGSPDPVEIIGTAVRAAGELAEIGLSVGTRALRGALERLPRP